MNGQARITIDPNVCGSHPCVRAMLVRVQDVLQLLASGATRSEILEDFPYLVDEDITASLLYAARLTEH